ncbi:hypothetical protein NDU88_006363, partial [Pleurodeles waltl]
VWARWVGAVLVFPEGGRSVLGCACARGTDCPEAHDGTGWSSGSSWPELLSSLWASSVGGVEMSGP